MKNRNALKVFFIFILCTGMATSTYAQTLKKSSPVHIVILLDYSKSIPQHVFTTFQNITHELFNHPAYHVRLLLVGENAVWAEDDSEIPATPTAQWTHFYDAISKAFVALRHEEGKRLIVAFTDGKDDGSVVTYEDIRTLLQSNNIPLFAIGVQQSETGFRILERLALLTGGRVWHWDTFELRDLENSVKELPIPKLQSLSTPPSSQVTPPPGPSPKPLPSVEASRAKSSPQTTQIIQEKTSQPFPLGWIGIALLGIFLIGIVIVFFVTRKSQAVRVCDTCGRILEKYELECSNCALAQVETHEPSSLEPEWFKHDEVPEPLTQTIVMHHQPVLFVRKGKHAGSVFQLPPNRPVTIGRSSQSEITLDDPTVSGFHCRIAQKNGQWFLIDLESTNGTFCNEHRVEKVIQLNPGDIIRIGSHELQFRLEPLST